MARTCRTGRHTINGPADLRPSGECIRCSREGQKRYRDRLIEARHRLAAIEAALAA